MYDKCRREAAFLPGDLIPILAPMMPRSDDEDHSASWQGVANLQRRTPVPVVLTSSTNIRRGAIFANLPATHSREGHLGDPIFHRVGHFVRC